MAQQEASEMDQQEVREQLSSQGKKNIVKMLPSLIKKAPFLLKALRKMDPDEERYVRPPRRYQLPTYRKDMKYCTSKETNLRPVPWCNYRDHSVIAMANELGAYQLPDYEYAEAAYLWMKDNVWYEFSDWYNAGETLRRGVGACMHLANTYIALCRCAGIKSRFKGFKIYMTPTQQQEFFAIQSDFNSMIDSVGGIVPELEAEVFVDGTWVTAYTPQPNALTAGTNGWPITEFRETGIGLYFDVVPGSIHRYEHISRDMGIHTKALTMLAPAMLQRVNVKMTRVQTRGRKYIEDAGGIEGYNVMARKRRAQMSPEEIIVSDMRERRAKLVKKAPE